MREVLRPVRYPPVGRVPPQFLLVTTLARVDSSSTAAIFQPVPYVVAQMVEADARDTPPGIP